MAHVHVLVGQCGNQLGRIFLDNLVTEAQASGEDDKFARRVSARHFRPFPALPPAATRSFYHRDLPPPPLPRCVMIDMEPKVIEGILANTSDAGAYRPHVRQCVTRDEGSANNWAFGFYHQGNSRREDIVESLRHESESCGTVGAFHVVHSIAGGTGSGVGCLVADIVREEFPRTLLVHSVVWPFSTGEVVTQWYNCVMAMSALRDTADAVFTAHNDDFGYVALRGKKGVCVKNKEEVSFSTINDGISRLMVDLHLPQKLCFAPPPPPTLEKQQQQQQQQLLSTITPSLSSSLLGNSSQRTSTNKSDHLAARRRQVLSDPGDTLCTCYLETLPLRHATLVDVVESVALDPALKFFSGVALPATSAPHARGGSEGGPSRWSALLREAARRSDELFLPAAGTVEMRRRSCLWCLRGPAVRGEGVAALRSVGYFSSYSPPTGSAFIDEGRYRGHAAHVSIFGPTRNIGVRLSNALRRAEELLSVDAFTHHFSRYGVGKDDMQDAIVRLWDTAMIYTPPSM